MQWYQRSPASPVYNHGTGHYPTTDNAPGFIIETTPPPLAGITMNPPHGGELRIGIDQLSWSAVDNTGSGLSSTPYNMSVASTGISTGGWVNLTVNAAAGVVDGTTYTWTLQVRDAALNQNAKTQTFIARDRTPPTLTLLVPANGATITSTMRPPMSWGASDHPSPGGVGLHSTAPYEFSLTGPSGTVVNPIWIDAANFTPASDLPNGSYTWTVKARDNAGNMSAAQTRSFTIDYTPPDATPPSQNAPLLACLDTGQGAATNRITVRIVPSGSDNLGITGWYASESAAQPAHNAVGWRPVAPPSAAGAAWSATGWFSFRPDGAAHKRVYTWLKDAAGNVSARETATIRLDGDAPKPGGLDPLATVRLYAGSPDGATGDANGTGAAARFFEACTLALDDADPPALYLADHGNRKIRKIVPAAGGYGAVSTFLSPGFRSQGVAWGRPGGTPRLFFGKQNGTPKKVYRAGFSLLASPGEWHDDFDDPRGIALSPDGAWTYVADFARHTVYRGPAGASGASSATPFAGLPGTGGHIDGPLAVARFRNPFGLATDAHGTLYVSEFTNNALRAVDPAGFVVTLAGGSGGAADGVGAAAQFAAPHQIAVDGSGVLYVADQSNGRIRRVSPGGRATVLAGSGPYAYGNPYQEGEGATARFTYLAGLAVDKHRNVYVAEFDNGSVRGNRVSRITQITPGGVAINGGALWTALQTVKVQLHATDDRGVTHYLLAESGSEQPTPLATDGRWMAHAFPAVPGSLEVDLTLSPAKPENKTVHAWFRDEAGNVSVVARASIKYADPPEPMLLGSVAIRGAPGVLSTREVLLDLTVASEANFNLKAAAYCLADAAVASPPAMPPGPWTALSPPSNEPFSVPYRIASPGDGPKTILAWFRDAAGYLSPAAVCGVTIDTEPPAVTDFKLFENVRGAWVFADDWTNRPGIRLRIDATDAGLGVAGWCAKVSSDAPAAPAANDPGWNAVGPVANFSSSVDFTLSRVNGEKRIWLFVRDAGGNVSPVAGPVAISLDTVAPVAGTRECEVTTVAGDGLPAADDGPGATASFQNPDGIAVDRDGTYLVTDRRNFRVRRIARDGFTSFLAGGATGAADGTGAAAQFREPTGISVDRDGTYVVTDLYNHRIRRVTPGGIVTTVAGSSLGYRDGAGAAAQFQSPSGSLVDRDGTYVVVEHLGCRVRRVTPAGSVSTVAGSDAGFADGPGATARFDHPRSIALDRDGTYVLVESAGRRVRRVTPDGFVTTVAGNGVAGDEDGVRAAARFRGPSGIAVGDDGSYLMVDFVSHRVRRVTPTGVVTTLAGSGQGFADGRGAAALFDTPTVITADRDGSFLVTEFGGHRIRRIRSHDSGHGLSREGERIRITSEEDHSGIDGFYLSYTSTPPRHDAPTAASFTGAGDLDKWVAVADHTVSHLPYTREIEFVPEKTLHGWFRDRAGNVSSRSTLTKQQFAGGMRAVAQVGGPGTLRDPRHVAVSADGALLVADANLSAVSPVHRFMNESDATGARVGFTGVERDRMAADVAGLAALPDGAFALAERGKHRVAIYDDRARLLDVIARRIDLAANFHGIGALAELQAKLLDRYASAADHARADARIFPTQSSAEPVRDYRVTTLEVFSGDGTTERLEATVRVTARRTLTLQARGIGPKGGDAVRSLLVAARSSADPRGVAVQLIETGTATNLFRGRLELDILPGAEQGRLVIAEGAGQLWFEVPGDPAARRSFPTFRPRPFKTTPGTYAGEENELDLGDGVTMTFVWIPPGTFMMGSPESDPEATPDEKPQHQVTITRGFWMQQTECTQGQWMKVMGSWPNMAPSVSDGVGNNYPAYFISWFDAVNYCNRLSQLQGFTPLYTDQGGDTVIDSGDTTIHVNWTAKGYRLPTEAEWEYACRAGTTTAYHWNSDTVNGDYLWYSENNTPSGSKPVATKRANAWNLHDMSGNLFEWCSDLYGETYFSGGSMTDPTGPTTGSFRVYRSAGWNSIAGNCRSADRFLNHPSYWDYILGFRPILQVGQ